MKKLSKILSESVWGSMLDRSTGDGIRKEDGKIVHTCLGVDIVIKNPDCEYDKHIKELIDHSMDTDYGVTIVNVQEKAYSWEELANARKFGAPYVYMIYDGGHGTDLLAEFWTYDEIQDFDLDDDFAEILSEDDYISICRGIATKLKEVGGDLSRVPRRDSGTLGHKTPDKDYKGEYVLKLISEEDVFNWEATYDIDYDYVDEFLEDIFNKFPELEDVDFITWTFYNGANIGLPLNYNNLINFKKYQEFTKNWFKS